MDPFGLLIVCQLLDDVIDFIGMGEAADRDPDGGMVLQGNEYLPGVAGAMITWAA